jgi:preprotein translocase subunit Sss1
MSNEHDQDEGQDIVEQYLQSIAESCNASAEHAKACSRAARDSATAIIQIRNLIACVIILGLIGFILSILAPFLTK